MPASSATCSERDCWDHEIEHSPRPSSKKGDTTVAGVAAASVGGRWIAVYHVMANTTANMSRM